MPSESPVVRVLGIESSCDDTGVAVVTDNGKILSNCIHSQLKKHLSHGGIIPMVAMEYHMTNIDRVARQAIKESNIGSVKEGIDAIAVTTRPGLACSLQVGLNYAKLLAKKYSKPLIPIHHMQAHALMPLLEHRSIKFPFLALLLSGGHCLIAICKRYNDFELLGSSIDDAPGDLLDKIARRCRLRNLGPPYDSISGGASINMLSERERADKFKYFNSETLIPMLGNRGCDFSFSGYRGHFDSIIPIIDKLWQDGDREALLDELGHLSGSIQRSILVQVVKKLQRAIAYYRMHWRYQNRDAFADDDEKNSQKSFGIRSKLDDEFLDIVVSGGVAANQYLIANIKKICQQEIDENIAVFAPSKLLCSDNGLMIAWNGILRFKDHISQKSKYGVKLRNLDEGVIIDQDQMDDIIVKPESPIGCDIRQRVRLANFNLYRLRSPEIVGRKHY